MNKIKILELDDICKYYKSNGQCRKGIKKIYIQSAYPMYIEDNKEKFIKLLKRKYKLSIIKLIGIYREKETWGQVCVYYK